MSKGNSTKRFLSTPTSLAGRRVIGAKGSVFNDTIRKTLTPEQVRWNAQVEAKRKAK